jgi:phospholipase/lecithinase/hemolysin
MMKRIFQIGIFLVVIAFAVSATAQMDWAHPRYQSPKVYVIGDSLSDPGNLYKLTRKVGPPTVPFPPSPPYAKRFSNGPVWTEYFARQLNVRLQSYAYGGAMTGEYESPFGRFSNFDSFAYMLPPYDLPDNLPGVQEEVGELVAAHPTGLNPDALYVIWAGANDFFFGGLALGDVGVVIPQAVENIVTTVCTLSAAGARHFAVANLPDIGLTPFGISQGQPNASLLTEATIAFNEGLAAELSALPCAAEVETLAILDVFTFLTGVVDHPRAYGFKNVTDQCLTVFKDLSYTICRRPNTYLFWDDVHPTTAGHALLALHFLKELCGCGAGHYEWGPRHGDWGKEQPPFLRQLCSGAR